MRNHKPLQKKTNNLISFFLLTCLFFWPSGDILAEQADVMTPSYYASKFMKFSHEFLPHLDQLDECLGEMDRFERGEAFIEPVACLEFEAMRDQTIVLIKERLMLQTRYSDTIQGFRDHGTPPENWSKLGPEAKAIRKIDTARELTTSLFDEYVAKYRIFETQFERTQKLKLILLRNAETIITGFDLDEELGMRSKDEKESAQKFLRTSTANLVAKRHASCLAATFSAQYCGCVDQHLVWILDWESFAETSQLPRSKIKTLYLSPETHQKRKLSEHILIVTKKCEGLKP
jgi:hypothetical protein